MKFQHRSDGIPHTQEKGWREVCLISLNDIFKLIGLIIWLELSKWRPDIALTDEVSISETAHHYPNHTKNLETYGKKKHVNLFF